MLALLALGGDAVRASYHGCLHASVGEAVLREGLRPENPYHAGVGLRYYTLYPALGVLLGRVWGGSMWGFALIDTLAALLLAPALDALGRSLGLSFAARRAAFLAAVLGFNGLGWLGYFVAQGQPFGAPPVYALAPMTLMSEGFGWDGRLQAFLPKFLNVSSYAIALPFGLWALAAARARACWIPLGLALALNPLVGGFAGVVLLVWRLAAARASGLRATLGWACAGAGAALLALPCLLPSFVPSPGGPSLTGNPALGGGRIANLFGPQHLLLVPALLGFAHLARRERGRLFVPIALAALLVLVGEMPQSNEYKMARLLGLVLALPAGAFIASLGGRGRIAVALLGLATLPTALAVVRAYLDYGERTHLPSLEAALPPEVRAAERAADPRAVVVVQAPAEWLQATRGLVQGNPLAPILHHSLYADVPQIHNEGQPDLSDRLEDLRSQDFERMRHRLPTRPFLFLLPDAALEARLQSSGARELAPGAWMLPPAVTGG
ncbi:MAG: hypothetical protein IPJ19_09400 [Planctomycetes bacterium]|nr:hypothetical protein [Planctomycetota bacterium]